MRLSPSQNAQLAMLVEVGTSPKPGNVGPNQEFEDTSYHQFQASAVGAGPGLVDAEEGSPVGEAFYRAVEGSTLHAGGNTHFGSLLLLVPLVRAAGDQGVDSVDDVLRSTTVDDASLFYSAFQLTDVRLLDDFPQGLPDASSGDAPRQVRERGLSLYDVMEASADVDDVAREWATGFERTFETAETLGGFSETADTNEAVARTFLDMLRRHPDSHVAKRHGEHVAEDVTSMAGELDVISLNRRLRSDGINPGATADVLCAACFVALETGRMEV